jgi:hypothetical protein
MPVRGHADDADVHGRIAIQEAGLFTRSDSLSASLGEQDGNDLLASLRLIWEPSRDRFSFSLTDLVAVEDGVAVRLARATSGVPASPPATWFNLTSTFANHGEVRGIQRVDRLAIGYTAPDYVLRIGRQALTWGSGFVFRPMDLFDPFSPSAIDTEYKPGTDMLYTQWLFGGGSDLQVIVVPRPGRVGEAPSAEASSAAVHLHTVLAGHQTTWLLARDHGDWVGAIGVNGAWGGATWNVEVVPTFVQGGPTRVSAIGNISDAVTLAARNATLFVEYYRNGFGTNRGNVPIGSLPAELLGRLARGQLFDTRRNYLAAGVTLELSPLLSASSSVIADMDDGSVLALVAATYSLGDNLNLVGGVQIPIGPAGTEFGGTPALAASPALVASPTQLYLQLRRYF